MKNREAESKEVGTKRRMSPISRREFAMVSLAILGSPAVREGARAFSIMIPDIEDIPSLSSAARVFNLTVGTWDYEVRVKPEYALHDVLDNSLKAVSLRDVCDGTWRSCSVFVDGRPILFCTRSPAVTKRV